MATRSNRGILLSQPQKVAEAMLSTSLGVATETELLMQEHSTLPLFSLQPETREIPLTRGQVTIVDAADYDFLMQWKWFAKPNYKTWYARRSGLLPTGERKTFTLHRVLLDAPEHLKVDHIDGNGLNNTRANLRLATHQQNLFNRGAGSNSRSGYKGVHWDYHTNKWIVRVKVSGETFVFGVFDDVIEAARAHDKAAKELHGEFAWLNLGDNNE